MTIDLIACSKDSSDGFVRTVEFENKEQFLEQYKEFENDVPFSRWYLDLDGEDTQLVEDWLA